MVMSLDMKANKLQETKTTAVPVYVVSSLTVHNPLAFLVHPTPNWIIQFNIGGKDQNGRNAIEQCEQSSSNKLTKHITNKY